MDGHELLVERAFDDNTEIAGSLFAPFSIYDDFNQLYVLPLCDYKTANLHAKIEKQIYAQNRGQI